MNYLFWVQNQLQNLNGSANFTRFTLLSSQVSCLHHTGQSVPYRYLSLPCSLKSFTQARGSHLLHLLHLTLKLLELCFQVLNRLDVPGLDLEVLVQAIQSRNDFQAI